MNDTTKNIDFQGQYLYIGRIFLHNRMGSYPINKKIVRYNKMMGQRPHSTGKC